MSGKAMAPRAANRESVTAKVNKPLQEALDVYAAIEADYLDALLKTGVTFAPYDTNRAPAHALREQLATRGACIRNGGASVSAGFLSPACIACTDDCVSQTFEITNACHRDCYFCFNHNQKNYEYYCEHHFPWREQLAGLAAETSDVACIALTGGEPMLAPEETYAFFQTARGLFPQAHMRMYTSGDLLDASMLARLRESGLDEIRFSVKLDDTAEKQQQVLDVIQLSNDFISCVMVEMPIIPGTTDDMKSLLQAFSKRGVCSVNLLEFAYPMWNWEAFANRGFTLKNPPFPILYDYCYAGSLAVQGSEELCLELMFWALEKKLSIGLHYCSLENKHRSEMRQVNGPHTQIHPCYVFDSQDFFLKSAKVYGSDCAPVKEALRAQGCRELVYDSEDDSLTFSPRHLPYIKHLKQQGIFPVVSYNVVVEVNGSAALRELKIEPADDAPVAMLD